MDDTLILVDISDNEIGKMTKKEVHKQGKLHRAFSIFIVNGNKMLIQKRNKNKYHSGGLWANACCSHPRYKEKLEEATHRRMVEEIGIDCELKEMFHFIYKTDYAKELYEYEYDHVFVGNYDGKITINPEEIEEAKWVTFDELKKELIDNPNKFASWFIIAAPRVMEEIKSMS